MISEGGHDMSEPISPNPESSWRLLYRVGAVGAVIVLALLPLQMAVYLIWPLPDTVVGWFALFERNPFIGLVDMDLFLLLDNVLIGLMFLAMYVALKRTNPSLILIALTLELMAVTTYFSSNTAFEMLSLSDRYAAATAEPERSAIVAAGQAMVETWEGTAFGVAYVLGAVAILLASAVMLQSQTFSKTTGYVGVVFGLLSLVPATAGKIGLVFSLLSLLPMCIWLILIARRLFQLSRSSAPEAAGHHAPIRLSANEPLSQP
jgi:hypothetical protein